MSEEKDTREGRSLRDFFGLDGGEFMNTGLTLEEWMLTLNLERVNNSYVTQDRAEQRRRREIVVKLAAEGARIRAIDNFGSIVVETAVENVMEGDWKRLLDDIEWCSFRAVFTPGRKEEREALSPEVLAEYREQERHYASLWEPFRKLLELAYAGRPQRDDGEERH
jgi:hypothetical protein